MAKRSKKTKETKWPWLFPAALLIFVVGVLVFGALWQVPEDASRSTLQAGSSRSSALDPVIPQTLPTIPSESLPNALSPTKSSSQSHHDAVARRAERDVERIAEDASGYTLQLSVVCDPDNAAKVADVVRHDKNLFFLPVMLDQRACLRICWGTYNTKQEAEAERLPTALASIVPEPTSRPIAEVMP